MIDESETRDRVGIKLSFVDFCHQERRSCSALLGVIARTRAGELRTIRRIVPLHAAFVTGDVSLDWGLLSLASRGESDPIGLGSPSSESIFLLPAVDEKVVGGNNGCWIVVPALEEIVLQVFDEFAVARPVAAEEECDGFGACVSFGHDVFEIFIFDEGTSCPALHDDGVFDPGVSTDRSTTLNDDVRDILEMFHIGLSRGEAALGTVVEALESSVDGMTVVLLALEVERNSLEDRQEFDSVTGTCHLGESRVGFDLLPHNVAALSPDEGIDCLDVLLEAGDAADVLINNLLPDPDGGARSVRGVVGRGVDHGRNQQLDCEPDVASVLVGAPDVFTDLTGSFDELIRLSGVRRVVDVSLEIWALSFEFGTVRGANPLAWPLPCSFFLVLPSFLAAGLALLPSGVLDSSGILFDGILS